MDLPLNPITTHIAGAQRGGARQGRGKGFNQAMQEEGAENDAQSADGNKSAASRTTNRAAEANSGKDAASGDGKGLKVNLLA